MVASYPSSVRTFTNKVNLVDTVYADHINVLQDEVAALENSLGTTILTSSYGGVFAQTASWGSLSARISNIEAGLVVGIVGSPYFKKSGDNILPAPGAVGLGLKTTSGSANLLETTNAANVLRFNINFDGLPRVGTAAVVYVGSASHTALLDGIAAGATGDLFNPFLLIGI